MPHSLGGVATIPLCKDCHAKVHGADALNTGALVRKDKQRMREAGLYTGGSLPYGYRKTKDGKLAPHRQERALIDRIRKMRQKGYKLREIVSTLNGEKIKFRGGPLYREKVLRLLSAKPK